MNFEHENIKRKYECDNLLSTPNIMCTKMYLIYFTAFYKANNVNCLLTWKNISTSMGLDNFKQKTLYNDNPPCNIDSLND